MGTINVTLIHGLKLDGQPQVDAVLREPTAGDVIETSEDAERVVATPDGYQLLASPILVGSLALCRQIVSIGEIKGPLTLEELKKLHADDFNILQQASSALDAVSHKVTASGESNQDGERTGQGNRHPDNKDQ